MYSPPPPLFFTSISIMGCPIARKRRLEEAEVEQEQDTERPASKRKAHPLKLALDEGFGAESDASSEAEGEGEKDEEEAGETKGSEEEKEREAAVEVNREEMREYLMQDGRANGQVDKTHNDEGEREEETYQKEEIIFTADEGRLCIFEIIHKKCNHSYLWMKNFLQLNSSFSSNALCLINSSVFINFDQSVV